MRRLVSCPATSCMAWMSLGPPPGAPAPASAWTRAWSTAWRLGGRRYRRRNGSSNAVSTNLSWPNSSNLAVWTLHPTSYNSRMPTMPLMPGKLLRTWSASAKSGYGFADSTRPGCGAIACRTRSTSSSGSSTPSGLATMQMGAARQGASRCMSSVRDPRRRVCLGCSRKWTKPSARRQSSASPPSCSHPTSASPLLSRRANSRTPTCSL
mmetsp:Transcript_47139/g.131562  ORF Transcript_47139/g.131562 Transcript_47139/m.131562 type:complete len:209 (-) Transcript_47139:558-1184(-)